VARGGHPRALPTMPADDVKRCAWCGGWCSLGATSCSSCADLERELRELERLPMRADDAERELLELRAELERQADDA
jgi:hypothetical protein